MSRPDWWDEEPPRDDRLTGADATAGERERDEHDGLAAAAGRDAGNLADDDDELAALFAGAELADADADPAGDPAAEFAAWLRALEEADDEDEDEGDEVDDDEDEEDDPTRVLDDLDDWGQLDDWDIIEDSDALGGRDGGGGTAALDRDRAAPPPPARPRPWPQPRPQTRAVGAGLEAACDALTRDASTVALLAYGLAHPDARMRLVTRGRDGQLHPAPHLTTVRGLVQALSQFEDTLEVLLHALEADDGPRGGGPGGGRGGRHP